jgi:hypothetical protein
MSRSGCLICWDAVLINHWIAKCLDQSASLDVVAKENGLASSRSLKVILNMKSWKSTWRTPGFFFLNKNELRVYTGSQHGALRIGKVVINLPLTAGMHNTGARATKFCKVGPNIFWFSAWNFLHVTHLALRTSRWIFWKFGHPCLTAQRISR